MIWGSIFFVKQTFGFLSPTMPAADAGNNRQTAQRKYFRAFLMTVFETGGVELRVQR
jgi:hypothetical protein